METRGKESLWTGNFSEAETRRPDGVAVDDSMSSGDEQYFALAEAATDAIVVIGEDGDVRYANPAASRMFGHPRNDMVGENLTMLMPERLREAHENGFRRYLESGERNLNWEMVEMPALRASGEEFPVEVSFTEFAKEEDARYFAGFVRDVGERRRAEAERDRFFTLSLDMLCVANRDGYFERVNPAFEETLGYPVEELLGRPILDFIHPDDRAKTAEELEKLASGEPTVHFENRYIHADGSVVWLSWKAAPVAGEGVIYAAARDVTGRKRDEAEIKARNERQAAVAEMGRLALASPSLDALMDEAVGIVARTLDLEFSAVLELLPGGENLLIKSSFGWKGEVASGSFTLEAGRGSHAGYTLESNEPVVIEDIATEERFIVPKTLAKEGVVSGVSSIILGEEKPFGVLSVHTRERRRFTANDIDFVQSIANVIAAAVDHRRHEEEIKEQSERLREQAKILDLANVLIRDMDDRIILWNSGAEILYGFSPDEALGKTTHELLATEHPEPYEGIRAEIMAEGSWDGELVHTTRDGRRITVASHCVLHTDDEGNPVAILEVNNDVTELREAEEELGSAGRRFRSLVQNLSDVISIMDAGGVFLYVSPSVEEILGVEPEELVGTSGFDLIHPDDFERAGTFLAEVVEREGCFSTIELRLRREDGAWRHIEADVVSMLGDAAVGGVVATFRDVTERKLAGDALRRSESRFRSVFEQAADAVLVHDLEGRFVDANRRACESLGYSREEILAMSVPDMEVGVGLPKLDEIWERVASGETVTVEGVHRRKDGSEFPVEVKVGAFELEGRPLMLVLARDVTERKEAEREIHESHALLTSIIEGTDDSIFMKDERGRYVMVNSRAASLLGSSAGDIIGKTDSDLLPPEAADPLVEMDRLVMESGTPITVEEALPVGGAVKNFIVTKSAYRDHEGEVSGVIGVAIDVTELKEAEKALSQSEALFRAVVENAAENIFIVDAETKRVIQANEAFYDSLGYSPEEMGSLTLYDIVAHAPANIDRNIRRVLDAGRVFLGERVYLRKDGTFLDVEVGTAAISYGEAEVLCVVAHDITERKQAEEALSEVRDAERHRIARDLHDLSLQHIASALQMMQATQIEENLGDDSDLGRQVSALREAIRGLRGAIYDLRLEASLPLVRSIESLVEMNRRFAPDIETTLEVSESCPSDLPEGVKTQLTRVFQESLTNVRKHSGARSVRAFLDCEDGWIEVSVADDGRGFDPPEISSRPDSGYGVGLSGMAERMRAVGGELFVESEPGKGTKVIFRAPLGNGVRGRRG